MIRTIAVAALLAVTAASSSGSDQTGAEPRTIHIVAERFAFAPSVIRVEQGAVLDLRISSDDTDHGFKLAGPHGVDVEIPKRGRGEVRVRFEATTPGRYQFECSRICGAGHGFMRGEIRVEPKR
jgi:cytochrome c oxidase subunit 2